MNFGELDWHPSKTALKCDGINLIAKGFVKLVSIN